MAPGCRERVHDFLDVCFSSPAQSQPRPSVLRDLSVPFGTDARCEGKPKVDRSTGRATGGSVPYENPETSSRHWVHSWVRRDLSVTLGFTRALECRQRDELAHRCRLDELPQGDRPQEPRRGENPPLHRSGSRLIAVTATTTGSTDRFSSRRRRREHG